jgi:hypothetical protein
VRKSERPHLHTVQGLFFTRFFYFRSEPTCIPLVVDLLVKALTRTHAQVRLSAFQVTSEIFQRSHQFRLILVGDHLDEVMECCLETNPALPMPPPKAAAAQLKRTALETVQKWVKEFGSGYKKLALGYNYLKQVCNFSVTIFEHTLLI